MKEITEDRFSQVLEKAQEVHVAEEKKIEGISIESLIKMGKLEKTLDVVPGITVTMHALDDEEKVKAMRLVEIDITNLTQSQRIEEMKRPLLSYAITKINNLDFIGEEGQKLMYDTLKKMPSPLVDLMNVEYINVYAQQIEQVTNGLKKN